MNYVPSMQVVHTQANMDKDFPQEIVREELPFLLFDGRTEVSMLAMLHYNTNGLLSDKTVIIANDKVTVNFHHDLYLLHSLKRCTFW